MQDEQEARIFDPSQLEQYSMDLSPEGDPGDETGVVGVSARPGVDASPIFAWALFMLITFWTPLCLTIYWLWLR